MPAVSKNSKTFCFRCEVCFFESILDVKEFPAFETFIDEISEKEYEELLEKIISILPLNKLKELNNARSK